MFGGVRKMTDLAVLGLEIKSKGVTETKALDGFSAASKMQREPLRRFRRGRRGLARALSPWRSPQKLARHEDDKSFAASARCGRFPCLPGSRLSWCWRSGGTQVYDIFASSKER